MTPISQTLSRFLRPANFDAHWQVATAPWRQRKTEKSYWGLLSVAVMIGLLGVVFVLVGQSSSKVFWAGASVCGTLLICCVWGLQMGGALFYNHPQHVRLVPGYLSVQKRVAVVLWLVSAFLQGLIVWRVATLMPADALPGFLRTLFLAFLVGAVALIGVAMTVRWVWFLLALWLLAEGLFRYLCPVVDVASGGHWVLLEYPYVSGLLVLVALGWLLTRAILGDGSAAHRAQYARRAQISRLMKQDPTQKGITAFMAGSKLSTWLLPLHYPYLQYLQWQLKHAQSTPRSAMARLEIGLVGNSHWVHQLTNVVWYLVLMALALAFTHAVWGMGWDAVFSSGAVGGFVILAGFCPLADLHNSMLRSQRGQGLLVLLPGVPNGVRLNHALAKGHLFRLVLTWIALAAILLLLPLAPDDREFAWLVWTAYVPMMPSELQDWSKVRVIPGPQALFSALKFVTGLLVGSLLHYYLGISLGWITLASVAVFALHTAWRWRKLSVYPQALPVGRLAL